MERVLFKGKILNFDGNGKHQYFERGVLLVEDGKIVFVGDSRDIKVEEARVVDFGDLFIMPSFVDTHVHLPQTRIRGRIEKDGLLEWLNRYVFREEARFAEPGYAEEVADEFFQELLSNGVTLSAVYGTVHRDAVDIFFEVAKKKRIRALIGLVLMEREAPDELIRYGRDGIKHSIELYEKWNGYDDRLYFVFTPRFAITSNMETLKKIGEIKREFDPYIQTHLSENIKEVERVKELFPQIPTYTEVYERAGILGDKTIMAHAIHLEEREYRILKETGTKIAHCPSSNFFLHSGIMNLKKMKEYGITVGLGSDVGAGPSFSPFSVMRDMFYANPVSPFEAFYHATFMGAKTLSMEDRIGNFAPGKEADFIVVDPYPLLSGGENLEEILSRLIFEGGKSSIVATFIRGNAVHIRNSKNSH